MTRVDMSDDKSMVQEMLYEPISRSESSNLLRTSALWACPVAIVEVRGGASRTKQAGLFAPPSDVLCRVLGSVSGWSCGGFPTCFTWAANEGKRRSDRKGLFALTCPKRKCLLVRRLNVPERFGLRLVCGCLPSSTIDSKFESTRHSSESLSDPSILAGKLSEHSRSQIEACFVDLAGDVEKVLSALWDSLRLADEGRRKSARIESAFEGLIRLLDKPLDARIIQEAVCTLQDVLLLGHLKAQCDFRGNASLCPQWVTSLNIKNGEDRKSWKKVRVSLKGILLKGWSEPKNNNIRDWFPYSEMKERRDPLLELIQSAVKKVPKGAWVVVGWSSNEVGESSCDVDPQCQYVRSCELMASESHQNRNQSLRRLHAIDVMILPGIPILEGRASLAFLQVATRLSLLSDEVTSAEDLALRGLASLSEYDQRRYLRSLFERCKLIRERQQKGKAFERFASGLLGLVPGWRLSGVNVTDFSLTKEFDSTIFIEPASPVAKYWYDRFGPMIVVECKNYPDVKKPLKAIHVVRAQTSKHISPVAKLRQRMRESGIKLSFLVTSGIFHEDLWKEVGQTERSRGEEPGRLVVLLDQTDILRMIDNPGDIERHLKERVSLAEARLCPGLTMNTRYGPRRRTHGQAERPAAR